MEIMNLTKMNQESIKMEKCRVCNYLINSDELSEKLTEQEKMNLIKSLKKSILESKKTLMQLGVLIH